MKRDHQWKKDHFCFETLVNSKNLITCSTENCKLLIAHQSYSETQEKCPLEARQHHPPPPTPPHPSEISLPFSEPTVLLHTPNFSSALWPGWAGQNVYMEKSWSSYAIERWLFYPCKRFFSLVHGSTNFVRRYKEKWLAQGSLACDTDETKLWLSPSAKQRPNSCSAPSP